ncbi:MAG TPA: response regulator [Caulobacteraceae bacterium]|jgi:DNA-binding response OmpR family regulator
MASPAPRPRVLVVDDEWLIAELIADVLKDAGFEVVGPAPRVSVALALIDAKAPAAAVLDVSLGAERSFPIARVLAERGAPFVFMTGYGGADVPAEFSGYPLLGKPAAITTLGQEVRKLLASRSRRRRPPPTLTLGTASPIPARSFAPASERGASRAGAPK